MLELFHHARERIVHRKLRQSSACFMSIRVYPEAQQNMDMQIIPKIIFLVIRIPIFGNYFPRPTAEEAALSVAELQQRHDEGKAR